MNRQTLLVTVCLIASTPQLAAAAKSTASSSFVIPVEYDKLVQWLDVNRLKVLKAGNCEVVATQPNSLYRVRTSTPLGACTYVVRETVENGEGRRTFRIHYVRNIKGRITDQRITLALLDDEGTKARVDIYTVFRGYLIPNRAVKKIQEECIVGIKRCLSTAAVNRSER